MAELISIVSGRRFPDLSGQRFGRLTVLSFAGRSRSEQLWNCRCECGTETVVRKGSLMKGTTQSCGCLHRERTAASNSSHGFTRGTKKRSEYKIWGAMIRRCYKPHDISYPNYGARGVTVCDRWRYGEPPLSAFECFIADMGEKPSPKHSIERLDNNAPYGPKNCRWATRKEQSRNKRNNRYVTVQGERMLFVEACERFGIRFASARTRLRKGWSDDRAFLEPLHNQN